MAGVLIRREDLHLQAHEGHTCTEKRPCGAEGESGHP